MRQQGISLLRQSLLTPAPLDQKLKSITDTIVRLFDADFCRIWLIRPGDLCEKGCMHAEAPEGPHACRDRDALPASGVEFGPVHPHGRQSPRPRSVRLLRDRATRLGRSAQDPHQRCAERSSHSRSRMGTQPGARVVRGIPTSTPPAGNRWGSGPLRQAPHSARFNTRCSMDSAAPWR